MLSLVSTWMADRLGTLGAVGIPFSYFTFYLQKYLCINYKPIEVMVLEGKENYFTF